MSVLTEFKEALKGLKSLFVGLRITGREFVKPQVTVHYPRKVVDNIVTFRGHIELVGGKDPAVPKCITCMMCQSVCPSSCIKIVKHPPPKKEAPAEKPSEALASGLEPKTKPAPPSKEKPVKTPKAFFLDYNYCSLCGLCVQSCPVDSLRFSTDVYLAGPSRKTFVYDLMARLKAQAEAEPKPEPKAKPTPEPKPETADAAAAATGGESEKEKA